MLSKIQNSLKFNRIALALLDACTVALSGYLAFFVRFDFHFQSIPQSYLDIWMAALPVYIIVTLVVFCLFGMYRFMWDSISASDLGRIVLAVGASNILSVIYSYAIGQPLPKSVAFMSCIFQLCFYCLLRYCYRIYDSIFRKHSRISQANKNVMLIGGGAAGRAVVREYNTSELLKDRICCIIDDDSAKHGKFIEGIKIVGGKEDIGHYAKKYDIDEIVFAIPAATTEERRDILNICKDTGCKLKTIPGMFQLVTGEVSATQIRDVQVEDLLGRDPVNLDMSSMNEFIGGKRILVTGGGGSIGSELCRQIARFKPAKLIIMDIYENNAYDIQQELKRTYGSALDLRVEICSVRDKTKIYRLFEYHRPNIVFHAAAHKHVPLMEDCPEEAVKNNIFGTWHVMRAAENTGVSKFVMISTDKAVNPTNIMGATKRFCEMMMLSLTDSRTEYCAVRFGNVLGSNGSVVPLFKKQIANGGPVTITDKRIIRYFMTIPEAAQLVLEAGSMAKRNQIFVLDMGEPVKILDLAENLIRLSGHVPYKDIDIKEIGLRSGEKLYEELLMSARNLVPTTNKKIFVEEQEHIDKNEILSHMETLDKTMVRLNEEAQACSGNMDAVIAQRKAASDQIYAMIHEFVPTFKDPTTYNSVVES